MINANTRKALRALLAESAGDNWIARDGMVHRKDADERENIAKFYCTHSSHLAVAAVNVCGALLDTIEDLESKLKNLRHRKPKVWKPLADAPRDGTWILVWEDGGESPQVMRWASWGDLTSRLNDQPHGWEVRCDKPSGGYGYFRRGVDDVNGVFMLIPKP